MSTLPSRSESSLESQRMTSSNAAVIGKSVIVKGQIYSREDLTIDGEVEGTVELQEHRLTVGPNGKVTAGIKAREIVVLGTVHGNVEASDKIDIRKEAKLVGDIRTARIVIEDGAYFKGNIDIQRNTVAAAPKLQATATVTPAPAAAPKPAVTGGAPNSSPAMAAGAGDVKR